MDRLVVQFVYLTGLQTNISKILATFDDNFDVLAAFCTIDVASAVHAIASQFRPSVCPSH